MTDNGNGGGLGERIIVRLVTVAAVWVLLMLTCSGGCGGCSGCSGTSSRKTETHYPEQRRGWSLS